MIVPQGHSLLGADTSDFIGAMQAEGPCAGELLWWQADEAFGLSSMRSSVWQTLASWLRYGKPS